MADLPHVRATRRRRPRERRRPRPGLHERRRMGVHGDPGSGWPERRQPHPGARL